MEKRNPHSDGYDYSELDGRQMDFSSSAKH